MSTTAFDTIASAETRREERREIAQDERDRAAVADLRAEINSAIGTLQAAADVYRGTMPLTAQIYRGQADRLSTRLRLADDVLRRLT